MPWYHFWKRTTQIDGALKKNKNFAVEEYVVVNYERGDYAEEIMDTKSGGFG